MKICLLQTDIAWGDAALNIQQAESLLATHPEADFYILPEMWCTGFQMQPDANTAAAGRAGLQWMQETATQRDIAIAGSLPLTFTKQEAAQDFLEVSPKGQEAFRKNQEGFHNTLVVADGKRLTFYNKRHLFTYGGEPVAYTAGCERVIVEVRSWRILLQVCYDLRFPVFSRCCGGDYDLILYVANWPASRQNAWDTLLRARAIENQCYVCGLNRVGHDPACTYGGRSAFISPRGEVLALLNADAASATVTLGDDEMAALRRFRHKFPALADADHFTISPPTHCPMPVHDQASPSL